MCLTGRWIEADEAVAAGIAFRSVPSAELEGHVQALAASLVTALPGAQFETKALLAGYVLDGASAQQSREREAQSRRIRELAALLQG